MKLKFRQTNPITKTIEAVIFGSRWVLVPFYFGLVFAQVLYCVKFIEMVAATSEDFHNLDETHLMLAVLTLIDAAMVANLLKMIIAGSYQTFIDKQSGPDSEKIGSGLLKVKMGSSLIGVSSIHLLQTFLNTDGVNDRDIIVKVSIHLVFLVSTLGLAYIDHLHCKQLETHKT